jgi:RecA/RadA recombinase
MSTSDSNQNEKLNPIKKFDFGKLKEQLTKTFKKDSNLINKFGVGSDLKTPTEDDYIKLPSFWKPSNLPGIPFGRVTILAGCEDSGKTSFAIQAMKAAQNQGCAIIYTETEFKSQAQDFTCWGVDPDQIFLIQTKIAEQVFQLTITAAEKFAQDNPNAPLLVIIDSLGNVLSQRDSEIDLMDTISKVGGKGQINRLGLNRLIALTEMHPKIALLLISYTYDNIGSVGKTIAGGHAQSLFASLIYQTSRKAWYYRTEAGQKIKAGADVVFKLIKNHVYKYNPGAPEMTFRITREGMNLLEAKDKASEE